MDQKPRNVFDIATAAGKKPPRAAVSLPDEVRQGVKQIYEKVLGRHVMDYAAFEARGFKLEHRVRLSGYAFDMQAPVVLSDLQSIMQNIRPYFQDHQDTQQVGLIDSVLDDLSRMIQQNPKGDVRPFARPNKKAETGVDPR
ncbi:hypothetical protein [Micavibrio aeruginosavorus]|uniref:hypothetical protein n=1 Tax=Micavibrio aeruginosavorus TaxID=349221 RepID=UPI003F4AB48B